MEKSFSEKEAALPFIIVTNASSLVGRTLVENYKETFRILAISDISQREASVSHHPNISWLQKNINTVESIEDLASEIYNGDCIECVIHLSKSHFNYPKNYEKHLFHETKNILELTKLLNAKHFLLESSLDVYKTQKNNSEIIHESSEVTGGASCLRELEELTSKYKKHFKCSIVRTARIYSDWCENSTLYMLLLKQFSGLSRRIHIPASTENNFIHVNDVLSLFFQIIRKVNKLDAVNFFIACAPESYSNREILQKLSLLRRDTSNEDRDRNISSFFSKSMPLKRIKSGQIKNGSSARIDNSRTRQMLDWRTTRRYDLLRRLYVLTEMFEGYKNEWYRKSETLLVEHRNEKKSENHVPICRHDTEKLRKKLNDIILDPFNGPRFGFLQSLSTRKRNELTEQLFTTVADTVRFSDHHILLDYASDSAVYLYRNESSITEFRALLKTFYSVIMENSEYITWLFSHKDFNAEKLIFLLDCAADKAEECFEDMNRICIGSMTEEKATLHIDVPGKNNKEMISSSAIPVETRGTLRTKIFLN